MSNANPLRVRFGPFHLDEAQARLQRDGSAIELPPRAFQVLCELVRRAGQLVTKDELLDAVWGHRHVNEAALKNVVSQLRQALEDDARESRLIQTVARRGYRFIAPLTGESTAWTATTSLPLQAAALGSRLELAGRAAPLGRLRSALAASQQGHRQLVFVLGDAGIGKSALVESLMAESISRVAFGQCIEHYGSGEPYMPVLEALSALCRSERGADVVEAMRRVAPTWLLQMPWFAQGQDHRDAPFAAGTTQDRMLREFGELMDGIAAEHPVLLVLEDLHWSDDATVRLLGYLARRRGSTALMVLGTFRPTELILHDHPLASLRQALRLHHLCTEIDLESLSEAELGDYLTARFGHPAPDAFVQALHAHTSGLPLFVVNVVDELVDEGKLRHEAEGWTYPDRDGLAVPRSIAGVIELQIARMTPGQQRVLGAASVAGVEFLHQPLAEVLQMPAADLQALLDEMAERFSWLRCVGAIALADGLIGARYAFAHTMYRQVLYAQLLEPQRLLLHRRWAAALVALHGSSAHEFAAELALHFERGDMPVAAAGQLAIAAAGALSRGAGREAWRAARQALQLGQHAIDQSLELELRVLEAIALTRLHVASEPEVAAAFERARALGAVDSPAWSRALHGSWWVHFMRSELTQARSLADEMLVLANRRGDPHLRLAGLNAMGLTLMMMGDLPGAQTHLNTAIEAHEAQAGSHATLSVQDPGAEAALALALVSWLVGEPRRARQLSEHATALAIANQHPLSEVAALWVAAMMHALAGEFEKVLALTERLYGVIRDQEVPEGRSGFAWLHGRALVALGRVEEGLAEMRAAARTAVGLGIHFGLCDYHYHHAQACHVAGLEEEAQASIDAGLALARDGEEQMMLSPLLRLLAQTQAKQGATAMAAESFANAMGVARRQGAAFHELAALAAAQRAGSHAADPERLRQLLSRYGDDASPVIDAARRLLGSGQSTMN